MQSVDEGLHFAVAGYVHADLRGADVVVLSQPQDLLDYLGLRCSVKLVPTDEDQDSSGDGEQWWDGQGESPPVGQAGRKYSDGEDRAAAVAFP